MPTVYPIVWEPPVVTGRYRHLMRRDAPVWERWLAAFAPTVTGVAYDVAIGGSLPDDADATERELLAWRYTTALKIDVLLREAAGVWAVEVKPAANTSAIGAAMVYARLLAREEPELVVLGGGIVCEHLPLDIATIAEDLGIRTWRV